MIDAPTQRRIDKLHPHIRKEVADIIRIINTKILTGRAKVRITSGYRTFEEQAQLYAYGRTDKSRKKVTNAKPGYSWHSYGCAIDVCLVIDGNIISWDVKKDFDGDKQSDWMEVVSYFKKRGYRWGGDWRTFKDMPHFEKDIDYTLADLRKLHAQQNFIKDTSYLNINIPTQHNV